MSAAHATQFIEMKHREAPQWLIDRMEKLHNMPPPSPEVMQAQWRASMKLDEEECFQNPYKDVDYIR